MWITPVGVATVILVGIIASLLTGKTDLSTLDPELISPVCQWCLPLEARKHAGSAIRRARNKDIVENVEDETMISVNLKVRIVMIRL